jgi:hypothetical protein
MTDTHIFDKISEPFTPDQVAALDRYQHTGEFHPFTCPNRNDGKHRQNLIDLGGLVPTTRGWICQYCDYVQAWAHAWMALPTDQS